MSARDVSKGMRRQHRELGLELAAIALGMFFFGFALVPLYEVFCEITGLGGRTNARAAAVVEENVDLARTVRVEFVAAAASMAPWEFRPSSSSMRVHPGEIVEASFVARNLTDQRLTGQAVPSVAPGLAAAHFQKLECFCFTAQEFAPREERSLSVRFLIDPDMPEHLDTVTLAYTLYAARP
jgi:cytochrome c oxidase assembly protein subunit 11